MPSCLSPVWILQVTPIDSDIASSLATKTTLTAAHNSAVLPTEPHHPLSQAAVFGRRFSSAMLSQHSKSRVSSSAAALHSGSDSHARIASSLSTTTNTAATSDATRGVYADTGAESSNKNNSCSSSGEVMVSIKSDGYSHLFRVPVSKLQECEKFYR